MRAALMTTGLLGGLLLAGAAPAQTVADDGAMPGQLVLNLAASSAAATSLPRASGIHAAENRLNDIRSNDIRSNDITGRAPAAKPALGAIPAQLTTAQRTTYRAIFAAIRGGDWSAAAARLDAMGSGPLHAFARAELYLGKGSPKAEAEKIVALVESAPELPQAEQLLRLAQSRGATALPVIPYARDLVTLTGAPVRGRARSTRADAVADQLGAAIRPLIQGDRPSEAEGKIDSADSALTEEARTEWRQRVAWSYYLTGDDANAYRLASLARRGSGEWVVHADWVAGLAAWRNRDCNNAADAFGSVARRAADSEMMAAGLFWAARADMVCGRPDKVQPRLRSAARLSETFYGLLATRALGVVPSVRPASAFIQADWTTLEKRPNIRTAAALGEIGEVAYADEAMRHQARIGTAQDHQALCHLAEHLSLPSTQLWLAHNGPSGSNPGAGTRYPAPNWTPDGGWRVDKALVFAHTLQESRFRADAVSRAGARGLMQVMPGTADLIARRQGRSIDRARLNDPSLNMELGQSYLEELRDFSSATGGLLPKVIAAYNAGPGSVQKWNDRMRDRGDPLLYIESIPFMETRGYVALVLRNYWMYQQNAGKSAASLSALAQGMWPKFPGMPGATAVRLDSLSRTANAD